MASKAQLNIYVDEEGEQIAKYCMQRQSTIQYGVGSLEKERACKWMHAPAEQQDNKFLLHNVKGTSMKTWWSNNNIAVPQPYFHEADHHVKT